MSRVLPTFRKDLEIIPRIKEGGGFNYLVKEPYSGEVFEFGEEEYFICQQFDGQKSFNDAQAAFQDCFGISLQLGQLEAFARKLQTEGFLASDSEASGVFPHVTIQPRTHQIFDPDRLFNKLAVIFKWCFSHAFIIGACFFFVLAFGTALKFGGDFVNELRVVWSPEFILLRITLRIILVQLLGEIAKGIACAHYGGYVHQFGLTFFSRDHPHFLL